MDIHQFCDYVNCFSGERPRGIRLGQWAFIVLNDGYPELANEIAGGSMDPFYLDSRLPEFLSYILSEVTVSPENKKNT